MEKLDLTFWHAKRVLITGHTGFKGSWLGLWLTELGAQVTGVALEPDTDPSLFNELGLTGVLDHHIIDVRDEPAVKDVVEQAQPELVFHLAAQPLVRRSYAEPLATWQTNVIGTLHLLEALRGLESPCAAVLVTTDKVYDNREWEFAYRESDSLGGHDPYSASKTAMEIAANSWRKSFFSPSSCTRLAIARAGNVIGGGDWAEDRILPDLVRALLQNRPLTVRNPGATRPWQHVLEPLWGYLLLARHLFEQEDIRYQDAFNFGPVSDANRPVEDLVEEALTHWPGTWTDQSSDAAPQEAGRLGLSIERARERLGWVPRWDFARAVRETMEWYIATRRDPQSNVRELSLASIQRYTAELVA